MLSTSGGSHNEVTLYYRCIQEDLEHTILHVDIVLFR